MNVLLLQRKPPERREYRHRFQRDGEGLSRGGHRDRDGPGGEQGHRGCVACLACKKNGKCVFDDLVNETAPKFAAADGLVIGTPVYYASANGTLISFLDRLFYSTPFDKTMKVGAAVAVARRGGVSATSMS